MPRGVYVLIQSDRYDLNQHLNNQHDNLDAMLPGSLYVSPRAPAPLAALAGDRLAVSSLSSSIVKNNLSVSSADMLLSARTHTEQNGRGSVVSGTQ